MPSESNTGRDQRTARLNLRASAAQQDVIRRAAAAENKSVTDFVLESATARAERALADRRWFVLSDERWDAFNELLDAPVSADPELYALLTEPTVLDEFEPEG